MIDWSYDLCSDAERTLWARLSVFPGGFDLEAAEQVCAESADDCDQVINVLDQLIAKSLVSVDRSGSTIRYSQLMTVREYGHESLHDSAERDAVYRRHRDHYLERAQRHARDWFSPRQSQVLDELRTDHANVIAALDWSLGAGDVIAAAQLAVALRYHWIAGGNLADGRLRGERLLTRLTSADAERGNVLWVTAWTALIQGDRDDAKAHLDECEQIARQLDDRRLQAHHDHWAALLALFCGDTASAIELYQRAIPVHREFDDPATVLTASFQLAMAQTYDGRLDDALATAAEVVDTAERHGERWNAAYALCVASVAHYHHGNLTKAADSARQALHIQRDFTDKICTALSIELLAWVAEATGDAARSAQLFGDARAVWQRLGTSVSAFGPQIAVDSADVTDRLRSTLGSRSFQEHITATSHLGIEAAVDLALGSASSATEDDEGDSANPLTRREQEVAALVAEGLSNRAIAERLVISRRTVDGHVEHILDKLGVGSRTQVVAWMQARKH